MIFFDKFCNEYEYKNIAPFTIFKEYVQIFYKFNANFKFKEKLLNNTLNIKNDYLKLVILLTTIKSEIIKLTYNFHKKHIYDYKIFKRKLYNF